MENEEKIIKEVESNGVNRIYIIGSDDVTLGWVDYVKDMDIDDYINKLGLSIPYCGNRKEQLYFNDSQYEKSTLHLIAEMGKIPFKLPIVININEKEFVTKIYIYIAKNLGKLVFLEEEETPEIRDIIVDCEPDQDKTSHQKYKIISFEEARSRLKKIGIDLDASYANLSEEEKQKITTTRAYGSMFDVALVCAMNLGPWLLKSVKKALYRE